MRPFTNDQKLGFNYLDTVLTTFQKSDRCDDPSHLEYSPELAKLVTKFRTRLDTEVKKLFPE